MPRRGVTRREVLRYAGAGGLVGAGLAGALPWALSDAAAADPEPLDPLTIPKYAHDLTIPRVAVPRVIRDSRGRVIRHDYELTSRVFRAQVLPPTLPRSTVFGYGSEVFLPGGGTEFREMSPGPVFENTRGIPNRTRFRNVMDGPHIFAVDPNVHWANPNAMEAVEPPFTPFPPGYAAAQSPLQHVTHTHGLVVAPQFDGTAEEWYDERGHRGPSFVSNVYEQPNEQPGTQLFYHDHVMGVTRLNVMAGIVGPGYFIRDPGSPLDRPGSPLPRGAFEIPLAISDRAFLTNGELDFIRVGANPHQPYFDAEDESNVVLVNGKTWPNLNVQRRQYRLRTLAASNMRMWQFQFELGLFSEEFLPFTIIGADGGYLPAPLVVDRVLMGITERADILIDFSRFAPGTQIFMRHTLPIVEEEDGEEEITLPDPETVGQVMRFTVVDSTPVPPPPLNPALFPARPRLVPDAPTRTKVTVRFRENDVLGDDNVTPTDRIRTLDGLEFSTPVTEIPLVGSTEQWDIVNTNEPDDDADAGFHMIHLHLIEFQILNRQRFDRDRFLQDWFIFNGRRPMTRPIVLPMDDYLEGDVIPPLPDETGWKDTAKAPPEHVTRIVARWAPQETPTGGVRPGQNQFPMDVEFPTSRDTFTSAGYVWHCHMLGHEDRDMMRPMPLCRPWASGVSYPVGRIIAYRNVNYRVRVAHTSRSSQPPTARFDLWERVNNNDGSWQPQIIYAIQDRVMHQGQLFEARHVHQARSGQAPPDRPDLWRRLPTTAKEQLVLFMDPDDPVQAPFFEIGQNGTEEDAREVLQAALAVGEPIERSASSGITENAIHFDLPDGQTFQPAPVPGTAYYQTHSQLFSITVPTLSAGQRVTVNGRTMRSGINYPLPPQRNHGYIIQTTGGARFTAR
jgi:FtsP/CotA-like multicopper oxidase with cupredoxin domain